MELTAHSLRKIFSTHREILLFAVIGVFNTAAHTMTVILLVETAILTPVPANFFGFCIANIFSFVANSKFTFRKPLTFSGYWKFLQVSFLSLVLTITLAGLASVMNWHYMFGLILVVIFGPILTFVLHKIYTFRLI